MNHDVTKERTAFDMISDYGFDDSSVFVSPDFEDAIVGVSTDGNVIYEYSKMVKCLMEEDGMTDEEAIDWLGFNTIRTIPYMNDPSPIIIYSFEER